MNLQYVDSFIKYKKTLDSDIIEIHNRPSYIKLLRKKFYNKLILYFHNDPIQMNGSKTLNEREKLLKSVDKIIFNSEWCRKRFFIDFINTDNLINKTDVCFQSSSKVDIDFKKKRKTNFICR